MNDSCEHVHEIADALARHDLPGLPSIDELDDATVIVYKELAVSVLQQAADDGLRADISCH